MEETRAGLKSPFRKCLSGHTKPLKAQYMFLPFLNDSIPKGLSRNGSSLELCS